MQLSNPKLFREQAYINGQWVNADKGATFAVNNPATGEVIANVPDMGAAETKNAIAAAAKAFQAWSKLSGNERGKILRSWYQLILDNVEDLAKLMTLEQGKPINEARGEVAYGAEFLRWFTEEAHRVYGEVMPTPKDGRRFMTIKQPIGVVGAITPWNFPSSMITRKVSPALAAGCTIVLKPAEDTPLSALALAELASEAGIPAGVFNIVTSNHPDTVGKELTKNPIVKKISFTGSTEIGKLLMQQAASTVKKVSLELGGNAPMIIFDDADLDAAVDGTIVSKFRNSGQTCISPNRIYVQDKIYDAFAKKLAAKVKQMKVGPGFEEQNVQGPLINEDALNKVKNHVEDAVNKGGQILTGGKPLQGTFFEPTVIINATQDMRVASEETFGPVAPLFRFKTPEEAIQMANDTHYGLASYFYSQDINKILQVTDALEFGMVAVNTPSLSNEASPFGGIKESGIGREGSRHGMDEYLETKAICIG